MAYPEEILQKAREEFISNRDAFRRENERIRMKIYSSVPRVQEIEREIASTGYRLSMAVIKGGNVEKNVAEIKAFNEQKKKELGDLLAANGFSRDALDQKYLCPICCDTGVSGGKSCSCLEKLRKKYMYERLGDTKEAVYPTFEELDISLYGEYKSLMEATISKCRRYAEDFTLNSKNLLLVGRSGLGKTHVSKAMGKMIIDKGYDVFYVSYSTLVQNLESEKFMGGSGVNYQSYLNPVLSCELLILDDVGAERSTAFSSSLMYEIVNSRLSKHLPTVINTNCDDKALSEKYEDRTASRLLYCYSIMMFKGNDDIRKKLKYHLY